MILMSVRLGANDLVKTRAFYDATLGALGVPACSSPAEYPMVMWDLDGTKLILGPARDGEPATAGNGGTIIFNAPSEAAVKAWYDAGIAHGGTCEGGPDVRPLARGAYGAYLRDNDGNKIAAYYGLNMG